MEQQVELIVLCDRLLTSLACLFILVQTLLKCGCTFGMIEFLRGVVFLAYGPVGFSLPLTAQGEEVVKMKPPRSKLRGIKRKISS